MSNLKTNYIQLRKKQLQEEIDQMLLELNKLDARRQFIADQITARRGGIVELQLIEQELRLLMKAKKEKEVEGAEGPAEPS